MRYGTLSPEELVQQAVAHGIDTLVLTDINNTSAGIDFYRACLAQGVQPILGIEFRRKGELLYTGIARNREGYRELNELLTKHNLSRTPLPDRPPPLPNAHIIYPLGRMDPGKLKENEFLGVRPTQANQTLRMDKERMIVQAPVTFSGPEGHQVHRLLRAVDHNIVVDKLNPAACATPFESFHPTDQVLAPFEPFSQIVRNTEQLLSDCGIEIDLNSVKNRKTFTGSKYDDKLLLEKLAYEGLLYRYGHMDKRARERVDMELEVVDRLGFTAYFLITWDIVRYAEIRGFQHVGRGSGANSVVAYCLRITDVEPIELDLYFERFINDRRTSPPDFDIDFSWDERDDVTDYIFKRYGHEHTALLATYATFKGRSIIRELGKVFGLPKDEVDTIVHAPKAREQQHGLADKILRWGKHMISFPNYLGVHAGGVIISEEPLSYYTAFDLPPKGFPITQWDMVVAEDAGFYKYDILSQRGLGHIKDTVKIVQRNKGQHLDVHRIKEIKEDPNVKATLRSGNCLGCFYVESPAMRGLLKKLECDDYISLVAASSIIRPGVAKSGMMRAYIERFHDPTNIAYLHPSFAEHLGETFGVMVYQEDVIKILHHFAGLDLSEADHVRKLMSGKTRGSNQMATVKQKFFTNCDERGYPRSLSEEVWRQIESFAGYSFAKGHSASFAVESFQSLYLKTYHPKEFMVAVINNFGGFYRTEIYVHEARMAGARIEAPCVNRSQHLTSIQGDDVFLGFVHLRDMERRSSRMILVERERGGPFADLEDFVLRVPLPRDQLITLIRIGAFRFTGKSKQQLLWEKNSFLPDNKPQVAQPLLLHAPAEQYETPPLEERPMEEAFDQIELLGFPLCSPFDLLRTPHRGDVMARDLTKHLGKTVRMMGYYVTRKPVTTVNGKHMSFGTWLDVEGQFFDTTHFPPALKRDPFRGVGCYLIKGKVTEDFGFPSIEVQRMVKLETIPDPRY